MKPSIFYLSGIESERIICVISLIILMYKLICTTVLFRTDSSYIKDGVVRGMSENLIRPFHHRLIFYYYSERRPQNNT